VGVSEPITIAIVDDNEGTRSLLRALAERDPRLRVVAEAGDGLEAVDVVKRHHPDAVILDIMMPVATGLDAIPDIRRVSPDTRIIGYSAYEGYRDEAEALGAHGWCTKGVPWDALASTIIDLVDRHRESPDSSSAATGARPPTT
jgi:DNA-binding NarL/FixJ family response regulator